MSKKVLILVAVIIILLGGLGYYAYEHALDLEEIPVISSSSVNVLPAEDLSVIEEFCPLIVRAKVLRGSESYVEYFPDGTTKKYYTITPIKILEKYKDEVGLTEKTMKIAEHYYTEEIQGVKTRICKGDYRPLKVGKEYLLYLYFEPVCDNYTVFGIYQGKYPLSDEFLNGDVDELSLEVLEVGDEREGHYRRLAKEVQEKLRQMKASK